MTTLGRVVQLVECLPSIHEALGLLCSTTQTGHGGTCQHSQYSGWRDRRIRSPRLFLITQKVGSKLWVHVKLSIKSETHVITSVDSAVSEGWNSADSEWKDAFRPNKFFGKLYRAHHILYSSSTRRTNATCTCPLMNHFLQIPDGAMEQGMK